MADDADDLLPGRDFLTRQLAREPLQLVERVRLALQLERALREVECLLLVLELHAEKPVAAARDRARQRLGRVREDDIEQLAVHRASAVEQLARGDVRVDDMSALLDERERSRRVLHDRVEQKLALEQVLALLAQDATELVVRIDELADFIGAIRADREAEVAV